MCENLLEDSWVYIIKCLVIINITLAHLTLPRDKSHATCRHYSGPFLTNENSNSCNFSDVFEEGVFSLVPPLKVLSAEKLIT